MTDAPSPPTAPLDPPGPDRGVDAGERRVAWALFGLLVIGAIAALIAAAGGGSPSSGLAVGGDPVPTEGGETGDSGQATDAGTGDDGTGSDTTESFTIAVAGDLLIHESVAASAADADGGYDFTPQLAAVRDVIAGADLAICHLEVPLSADNRDLAYFPAFRVPFEVADLIASSGFDTCSVASNHALDAGPAGVASTIEHLDRAGIAHAGTATSADADAELNLLEVGDVTVAQLSYAYGLNGYDALPADGPHLVDLIDEAAILDEAGRARAAGADFVVASMHWGTEYQRELTEQQLTLAERLLASPEIDLVIGHHAHVVQEVRRYGDEYAVFGLGNLLSNQSPGTCSTCPPDTQDGVIVELTVTRADDGAWRVSHVGYTPTWVVLDGHRVVVADPAAGAAGATADELTASAARTAVALGPLAIPRGLDRGPSD